MEEILPTSFELRRNAERGAHYVALEPIKKHSLIMLEQPQCFVTPSLLMDAQEVDPTFTKVNYECLLSLELSRSTKPRSFFLNYVPHTLPAGQREKIDSDEAVNWIFRQLSSSNKRSMEEIREIFEVVSCNAFSLDTLVLGLNYGSAFYAKAAYFNHSCDPNAFSLRFGGNMAILANRDIVIGEEITHHYIPPQLLVFSKHRRKLYLTFECKCSRCLTETESESSTLELLLYPPNFTTTPLGKMIADFKTSVVTEDDQNVLKLGNQILPKAADFLREHPLAAIDFLCPYLHAFWTISLSGKIEELHNHSCSVALLYENAVHALESTRQGATIELLRLQADVIYYLLGGSLRQKVVPVLISAITKAFQIGNNTLECFRDDFTCFEVFHKTIQQRPNLHEISLAYLQGTTPVNPSITPITEDDDDDGNPPSAYAAAESRVKQLKEIMLDTCALATCGRQEEEIGLFKRCARCHAVKYCSREHQQAHWGSHKYVCKSDGTTAAAQSASS